MILMPLYGINHTLDIKIEYDTEAIEVIYTDLVPEVDADFYFLNPQEFLDSIAYFESRGIYNIANNMLMLGKYQFSFSTLKHYSKECGYSVKDIKYARKSIKKIDGMYQFDTVVFNRDMQEKIITCYMRDIENIFMKKYITEYTGDTVSGIRITKAGILSASMLGFKKVRKFLRTGKDFEDKYGTTVSDRLALFEDCELTFNF